MCTYYNAYNQIELFNQYISQPRVNENLSNMFQVLQKYFNDDDKIGDIFWNYCPDMTQLSKLLNSVSTILSDEQLCSQTGQLFIFYNSNLTPPISFFAMLNRFQNIQTVWNEIAKKFNTTPNELLNRIQHQTQENQQIASDQQTIQNSNNPLDVQNLLNHHPTQPTQQSIQNIQPVSQPTQQPTQPTQQPTQPTQPTPNSENWEIQNLSRDWSIFQSKKRELFSEAVSLFGRIYSAQSNNQIQDENEYYLVMIDEFRNLIPELVNMTFWSDAHQIFEDDLLGYNRFVKLFPIAVLFNILVSNPQQVFTTKTIQQLFSQNDSISDESLFHVYSVIARYYESLIQNNPISQVNTLMSETQKDYKNSWKDVFIKINQRCQNAILPESNPQTNQQVMNSIENNQQQQQTIFLEKDFKWIIEYSYSMYSMNMKFPNRIIEKLCDDYYQFYQEYNNKFEVNEVPLQTKEQINGQFGGDIHSIPSYLLSYPIVKFLNKLFANSGPSVLDFSSHLFDLKDWICQLNNEIFFYYFHIKNNQPLFSDYSQLQQATNTKKGESNSEQFYLSQINEYKTLNNIADIAPFRTELSQEERNQLGQNPLPYTNNFLRQFQPQQNPISNVVSQPILKTKSQAPKACSPCDTPSIAESTPAFVNVNPVRNNVRPTLAILPAVPITQNASATFDTILTWSMSSCKCLVILLVSPISAFNTFTFEVMSLTS
ncbi:hypothetical protein M9Y10_036883 [Tritrichomonas musculus]|uniref:Uncharacterized protein n=1 Tax=Tritrichomonas musculus TaxID=1915356 RepID=A0ABR2GT91_9EUKA